MADTTPAAPQAQATGLMHIGAVAAHNIALALSLGEEHVGTIEQAIKDEINAMSSHFTLAFADIETQFEVEKNKIAEVYKEVFEAAQLREQEAVAAFERKVAEIKSSYNWLRANRLTVGVASVVLLVVGALVGHFA